MKFDVLIIGGGLAGASLACALRGSRLRVGLVDRASPSIEPGWDTRVYAISPANVDFLRTCGAWDLLPPDRIGAIRRMDVAGDAGGRLQFDAYESGLDALACTVESSRLASELWETARRQSNVTVMSPAIPVSMQVSDQAVSISLADGRVLEARLLIGADGVNSWVRAQAGLGAEEAPYAEKGVVANFVTEKAHHDIAFQWFRSDGVLAYLPLPGNQISIVWSTPDEHAEALLALPAEEFAKRVTEAGQERLGKLSILGSAAAFPLRLMKVKNAFSERVLLVGDAAHAVHPLSGHGINLGFQDAKVLAQILLGEPAGADCGEARLLRRYVRKRAEEVMMVQSLTHGLHSLFKQQASPLMRVRNLGMSLMGSIPLARVTLARYAAGLI